ncbi:MAG: hypothetical protein FJ288_10970 [Planctomycetes bacterium]|nr:hypothetical protein [Planctomycetota bacterium]
MGTGRFLLAAAVAAAAARGAAADDFSVPLGVQEPAGVARQGAPMSGGVPLPRGKFPRDQAFWLAAADGREVPCQASPLVAETDGTLRWVLLDFQDDIAAGATNTYTLKAARSSAKPLRPTAVQETQDAVAIDTGAMHLLISKKKPFGLLDAVQVNGKPAVTGGEVSYVQMQGRKGWNDPAPWTPRKLLAGPPESVKLWYSGPMRVTVEAAGRFADDPLRAGYRAYITTWAGSTRAHLKYLLCNSNAEQYTHILVGRSAIELRLASAPGAVILGADKPVAADGEGWLHQGLRAEGIPDAAVLAKAGAADRVLWTGSRKNPAAGWIAAPPGVFVCDILFSANPARRLAVGRDGLVLEGIAEPFEAAKDARGRAAGRPWSAAGSWLFDCSHHTSEYLVDFAAPADGAALDRLARAARGRLWALAPSDYYSACEALAGGRFGSLADEKACYEKWGWKFSEKLAPDASQPQPGAFVPNEDNHYESEADSVQGLLLMYLRTGQRGWFDLAEAWARYHMDLQTWRTDGWRWNDGAIWFPQGGPLGTNPVRAKWNFTWGPRWAEREASPDCIDLWRLCMAKSCYCHFYGSGLADWFCLTGDRDAIDAAVDNVETKDDEFRRYRKFAPGKTEIGCIRGFGRGFEVLMRVLEADPGNTFVADLAHLCARTLWQSPLVDERGFHASHVGGGFSGMPAKELSPPIRQWMQEGGITFTQAGDTVDSLRKSDASWKVRCYGGTWQHVYIQNGADLYARRFDDDDMRDFTVAFARMSARYMLSPKCRQTWYYTYFDVPDLGMVFDPWAFEHTATQDGAGCQHDGWYTRFYPDACAKGFSWTGDRHLLEKGKDFWYYGSKRGYHTKNWTGKPDEVGMFARHVPPKEDQVLSTSRLFYEWSHPRGDARPPAAVTDLAVRVLGDGKAEVRFIAPADRGGGRVARYQVKAAALPIAAYDDWDYARDSGRKRNWWRAENLKGEPAPGKPGAPEKFIVSGVPAGERLYFAVCSYDDSWNCSEMSNVASP